MAPPNMSSFLVPVRESAVEAATYVTAPAPTPVAPDLIVIHPTPLTVCHAHPAAVFTVTVPSPPPVPMVAFAAESE